MSKKKSMRSKPSREFWDKPLNNDKEEKRKVQIINYDEEGNRLGDDGYAMTPTRKTLHNLLNIYFVAGIVVALFGLFCCVFSYFQGQEYSYIELVATGGTQLNGWDFAFLLRMEALFCVFVAILSVCINLAGFSWMYDNRAQHAFFVMLGLLISGSVTFFGLANIGVGVSEPISILAFLLTVFTCIYTYLAAKEKPSLCKPKIARTEVR